MAKKEGLRPMASEEILRAAVEAIRRRMPAGLDYKVFLFGSRAAGTAGERSDYDVGIEAKGGIPPGVIFGIEEELDRLPDLHKVEVVDFRGVSPDFERVAKKKTRVLA